MFITAKEDLHGCTRLHFSCWYPVILKHPEVIFYQVRHHKITVCTPESTGNQDVLMPNPINLHQQTFLLCALQYIQVSSWNQTNGTVIPLKIITSSHRTVVVVPLLNHAEPPCNSCLTASTSKQHLRPVHACFSVCEHLKLK